MSYRPNLNYFSHPSYVTQDSDAGVLRSRGGTRLLGISDDFLRGFVLACEDEAGSATPLLLRRCGSFYGQRLAERIERELQSFADTPLHSRTMPEFAALVEDLWNGLGMGRITADYRHVQLGLIAVQLQHSPMQDIGPRRAPQRRRIRTRARRRHPPVIPRSAASPSRSAARAGPARLRRALHEVVMDSAPVPALRLGRVPVAPYAAQAGASGCESRVGRVDRAGGHKQAIR